MRDTLSDELFALITQVVSIRARHADAAFIADETVIDVHAAVLAEIHNRGWSLSRCCSCCKTHRAEREREKFWGRSLACGADPNVGHVWFTMLSFALAQSVVR